MKTIHYFLFFIYIFSAQYLFSQDYFLKTVGNDTINTFLRAGLVVNDGYLVVGTLRGRLTGHDGIYLSELDAEGNMIQTTILDEDGEDGYTSVVNSGKQFIKLNNQTNEFVLTYPKYKTNAHIDPDIVLMKFTKQGDVLWTKQYGDNRRQGPQVVIETKDKGFIIAGWQERPTEPKEFATFYVVKTDSIGNEEWTQTYTLDERQVSAAYNIIETLDGGYLIGGYGNNITLLPLGNYGADKQSHLVKIDSLGNVEWEKSYGVAEYRWDDSELDVLQYPDSTYLVFGGRAVSKFGGLHQFFKHLDSQGETLSESIYEEGQRSSIYTGLHPLGDGGFIGIPYDRMLNNEGTVIVRPRMIRYTPFGTDTLWSKLLNIAPNMTGLGFRDVEPTPDGGFFIVGFSEHTSPQFGWVLKVDSLGNGCFEFGCDSSTITHIEELPKSEQKLFSLFPNPTQGEVTVSFSNDVREALKSLSRSLGKSELVVLDVAGRVLKRKNLSELDYKSFENFCSLGTSDLEAGIYFVHWRVDGKSLGVEKLVVY